MILQCTVDTDEIYGEDGVDFETLLSDSLRREVVNNCKKNLASDEFKRFSALAEESLMSNIKLRLENFLSEEIALTGEWGKVTFVGSIEDLIKQRFDDILLRPVDSGGNTLKGCTSSGKTWIEWKIEKLLKDDIKRETNLASSKIEREVKMQVADQLVEIKNKAIKKQVSETFSEILEK